MCEREGVYLGLRRGDAAALLVAGLALVVVPGNAGARGTVSAQQATDPAATTIETLGKYAVSTGIRDSAVWETKHGAAFEWKAMGDVLARMQKNKKMQAAA